MKQEMDSSHPLLRAFCQVVQERREILGISQEELAHRAGLHRTYISDIERGSRNISLRSLIRLAKALEVSASGLIRVAEKKVRSTEAGDGQEDVWGEAQEGFLEVFCKN